MVLWQASECKKCMVSNMENQVSYASFKIAAKFLDEREIHFLKDSECQKQCEDLNNFFSEVGKSLSTKIKPSPATYRHFIQHINF